MPVEVFNRCIQTWILNDVLHNLQAWNNMRVSKRWKNFTYSVLPNLYDFLSSMKHIQNNFEVPSHTAILYTASVYSDQAPKRLKKYHKKNHNHIVWNYKNVVYNKPKLVIFELCSKLENQTYLICVLLSQFFSVNQLIWFTNLAGHFIHAITMNEDGDLKL